MNPSKCNLYILTFVLFVVMLGCGIIIPIFPFYIESMSVGFMLLAFLVSILWIWPINAQEEVVNP